MSFGRNKKSNKPLSKILEFLAEEDSATGCGKQVLAGMGTDDGTAPSYVSLLGYLAQSAQRVAATAGNLVAAAATLYGEIVIAGYDWTQQYISTNEANPLSSQYSRVPVLEATGLGVTAGTYYPVPMDGWRKMSCQLELVNGASSTVTITIEGQVTEDAAWQDVSALWGAATWAGAASPGSNHTLTDISEYGGQFYQLRFKLVIAGSGSDAAVNIYVKKAY